MMVMREIFTNRAKKALEFAQDEAKKLRHRTVGTEHILYGLAKEGNGVYIRANNTSIGLDNILARINKMEKNEYEAVAYKNYDSKFYIFALISLFFLVLEWIIFERRNKYINRKLFFGNE